MITRKILSPPLAEPRSTVESGSFSDIDFFLRQIVRGAQDGKFSQIFLSPLTQFNFLKDCSRVLLRQAFADLIGRDRSMNRSQSTFLVTRFDHKTVGAMLVEAQPNESAPTLLFIRYVVVDPAWQRRGIGTRLLSEVLAHAPLSNVVHCECSPNAIGMTKILLNSGFKLIKPATKIGQFSQPNLFEYRGGKKVKNLAPKVWA